MVTVDVFFYLGCKIVLWFLLEVFVLIVGLVGHSFAWRIEKLIFVLEIEIIRRFFRTSIFIYSIDLLLQSK